jgi:hypothetical protein
MSNIAVITSSIGKETNLLSQEYTNSADFHAFVDSSKLTSNSSWKTIECVPYQSEGYFKNRINAKIFKILPFIFLSNYEYFIWLDSNLLLNQDPKFLVNKYLKKNDIALVKHNKRDCVYDEAKEVIIQQLDFSENIKSQYKYYKSENYPKNNGLYDCSLRIQRNTEEIKNMSVLWWSQIIKYSSRDQISLPFVFSKTNVEPYILNSKEDLITINHVQDTNSRKVENYHNNMFSRRVNLNRNFSLLKKRLK